MLIVLSGCPKAIPENPPPSPPAQSAEQLLEKEVSALAVEALALLKEQDELLWKHWTQGGPLELEKPALSHTVLFEDAALTRVREARGKKIGNPIGMQRLEAWLVSERLVRSVCSLSPSPSRWLTCSSRSSMACAR